VSAQGDGARWIALALPIVVAVSACGPVASVEGSTSPSPGSAVSTPAPTAGSAASPSIAGPSPVGPGASPHLVVDAELLKVLPPQIAGVALEPDSTTAAEIAANPELGDSVQAIAVALAISPGASSSGDDLAIVSVVHLRAGVFSDGWYANWRTTYDEAACDVAGGVRQTSSRATIAGRDVFVGSCAGDATTYHVRLTDPTLLVSITASGGRRFGELVIAGLAE